MARDNSPRERQRKQLERKLGRRASYDRILIVAEGSKTEPNYFSEIRAAYRLHTANVEVRASELGTAPSSSFALRPSPQCQALSYGCCCTTWTSRRRFTATRSCID